MNKPKTLAIALLITAAMTLPLKAAEQCCAPCPNGVLVGVTADSCGTCVDMAKFIPGCASADASGCTACKTGFTLSEGTCTSTQVATVSGLHCVTVNSFDLSQDLYSTITFSYLIFIPNCIACSSNRGCQTCAPGTTRTSTPLTGYICK